MFDFVLGSREEIFADDKGFLLAVKRMLPRWLNSIPDTEYRAICSLAESACQDSNRPVLVETGVGASTLPMVWYAARNGGRVYSWDTSGAKISAMRQVLNEAFTPLVGNTAPNWTAIPWSSTSPDLGIGCLEEIGVEVVFSFHDSDHTWSNLRAEVSAISPLMSDGGIIAIDDANLRWDSVNIGLVNTFRRKFGWPPLNEARVREQSGELHWKRVLNLLESQFELVNHLEDEYKSGFQTDPYFAWFGTEFAAKAELGTEQVEHLMHRFDAFQVSGRRP